MKSSYEVLFLPVVWVMGGLSVPTNLSLHPFHLARYQRERETLLSSHLSDLADPSLLCSPSSCDLMPDARQVDG